MSKAQNKPQYLEQIREINGGAKAADFESEHYRDENNNPKGGYAVGPGFSIQWQAGVGPQNGAFPETVLGAVLERFIELQNTRFCCSENASVMYALNHALEAIQSRSKDRTKRGVENTHEA